MGASDPARAEFAALLERAESKYAAWHLKELRPERDRRLSKLKKQKLTSGGRAVYAFQIYRELLERAVRQRIDFYSAVARESRNSGMLAKPRLDEFQQLIMTSVGHEMATLKDHITMDNRAAGDTPETALPNQNHYTHLESEILDVVNAELRVLEAEGSTAGILSDLPRPRESDDTLPKGGSSVQGIAEGAVEHSTVDDPFARLREERRRRFLQEPLPAPPSKVGGRATASLPSRRIVTGPINYLYPPDFPENSCDQVRAEEIRAARDFNEKCDGAHSEGELFALRTTCVMRPVRVFYREAIQLHWGASRIDKHVRDFVLKAQTWAGLPINPEAQLEFEKSVEWRKYEDALLALDVAPEHLEPEPAGDTGQKAESAAPAPPATVANGDGTPDDAGGTLTGTARKGDATLLAGKRSVSFRTAEQYLGITERHRQNLVNKGALTVEGQGQNRKITTESLKNYLPSENPK